MIRRPLFFILALAGGASLVAAWDNGVGRTPPMGFNNWNYFKSNINETLIKEIADSMVSTGMRDAGYVYLTVDDNWMTKNRSASGNLVPDPIRFAGGMKALGDYIHNKGLKFGMYLCYGPTTCQNLMGSEGHEQQDVDYCASCGADFLKVDVCALPSGSLNAKEKLFQECIKKNGRPMLYYIDGYGEGKEFTERPGDQLEYLWAGPYCHLIRIAGDSRPYYNTSVPWGANVVMTMDIMAPIMKYAGPGHWLDADMLQVGNGMSVEEDRSEFSFWAIVNSSLIAGNDIRKMSAATKSILLNKEVIAINQDTAGIASRVKSDGSHEIWCKNVKNSNSRAVLLVNRSSSSASMTVTWSDIKLPAGASYLIRDLWAKKDIGLFKESYSATVPAHGVVMITLVPPVAIAAPAGLARLRKIGAKPHLRLRMNAARGSVAQIETIAVTRGGNFDLYGRMVR